MFGIGKIFDKATGLEREYGPVEVNGYPLSCQVCRHGEFWHHRAQLHTPIASLLDFEFTNRTADCAVCARCGYVHWFLPTDLAPVRSGPEEDPALAQP